MPYLNIDFGFPDHIKTRRLVGLVGGNAEAEGLLLRLWCHVGCHHGDSGRLQGYTPQEIEAIVRWTGAAGAFVDALCKVGFLHRDVDGFRIHDWIGHQGHIGALKARAKKAAEERWGKIRNATSNARRIAKRPPKQCSFPSVPSSPSKEEKDNDKRLRATARDPVLESASGPPETALAAPKQKPLHVDFVERFKALYERVTEKPFNASQQHFVIAHRLIKAHGFDAVVDKVKILAVMCDKKTAWFTKAGWGDFSIEKLSNQWNAILAVSVKPTDEESYQQIKQKWREHDERVSQLLAS